MRVYALINCWPVVADPDRPPVPPPVEGDGTDDTDDTSPEWLEALDGVYHYDGLTAALGQPLSNHQHAILKKDGEITINDGAQEIRCFDLDPGPQVKGWVTKAFTQGSAAERERIWNVLCYFVSLLKIEHKLIDGATDPPLWFKTLVEFGEMVTDGTVAPMRYQMKGRKRGHVVKGSGPQTKVVDTPLDAPPDVCIECGSPLDDLGKCHFIGCGKAVEPKTTLDVILAAVEQAADRMAVTPAPQTTVMGPTAVDLCMACKRPMLTLRDDFRKCTNGDCRLIGIAVRNAPAVTPTTPPGGPIDTVCSAEWFSRRCIRVVGHKSQHMTAHGMLFEDGADKRCTSTFSGRQCELPGGHARVHGTLDGTHSWATSHQDRVDDTCALPPPALRAIDIGGPMSVAEAITEALAVIHRDDEGRR